ncbi:MAG TPA: hypothetical protein VLA14_13915 [Polyangia bacterium]|nr:hypothetical protein [Polyangia bacterium]
MATRRGAEDLGGGWRHSSNQIPELRGSTPGAARRCLRKLRST